MKKLILLALLFSLNTLAQVKTGTGGTKDDEGVTTGGGPVVYEKPSRKEQEQQVQAFVGLLRERDKVCRDKDKQIFSGKESIMDMYLRLVFIKAQFTPDMYCSTPQEYFNCLATEQVTKTAKLMKSDLLIKAYLQETYKIDRHQAIDLLEFYAKLGKKIKK